MEDEFFDSLQDEPKFMKLIKWFYKTFFLIPSILIIRTFFFGPINLAS
jgi:hypothetical protein